jgi:hypothetical protein
MLNPYPEQRFVRLRLATGRAHTITIVAARADDTTPPEENGVVKHIAANMPERHEAARALLQFLKEVEAEFFDWVEASPENCRRFIEDPLAALQSLRSDLPPSS